jgi:hypothetical protein
MYIHYSISIIQVFLLNTQNKIGFGSTENLGNNFWVTGGTFFGSEVLYVSVEEGYGNDDPSPK